MNQLHKSRIVILEMRKYDHFERQLFLSISVISKQHWTGCFKEKFCSEKKLNAIFHVSSKDFWTVSIEISKITLKKSKFVLMNHLHESIAQQKLPDCKCSRWWEKKSWSFQNWLAIITGIFFSPQSTDEAVLYTEQTSCICLLFYEVSRDSFSRKA